MDGATTSLIDHRSEDGDAGLARHLVGFDGRCVLVLGDVMLDRYVLGDVHRISPEAPIPVLKARQARAVPGGAANVARNIAAMGAHAILIGVVGADAGAADLGERLDATGGIIRSLVVNATRPTTVKTRFMSGPHQLLRLDEEDASALSPADAVAVCAAFDAAVVTAEAVVLSDYGKGVLTDAVLAHAITVARAAGVPVIADPKRADFSAYRGVTALTPNLGEVTRATGIDAEDDTSVEAAGRAALAQAGAAAIVVTRSERGLTLIDGDAAAIHMPTRARAVADVSGAGDTFVAALSIMLAAKAPLTDAAAIANIAAGVSVGKPGTATVDHTELAAALHERALLSLDTKISDRAAALARVEAWRARGLRVGFTNGCFDLIHPGHVRMLAAARARCDRLVVALNTDDSVRRLKGPTRPVQTETARATVMASIASADLVVLFDEDTPERLIEAIRPDVLFKGADYQLDQVVGGAFVVQHGGRVELIALEEGHSTTGTIRRMTERTDAVEVTHAHG